MEVQNTEILNTGHSNIGYSGIVTVKKLKNGKVVSSTKYHNAGTNLLYQFICECLAGQFASAQKLKPEYIRLFYNTGIASEPSDNTSLSASNTIFLNYSNIAAMPAGGYKAILHFTIPFAFITNEMVNEVRIYSASNRDIIENYSAKFYLKKETGEWDTIETIDEYKDNYNLIIEWEMHLTGGTDTTEGDN